MATEPDELRVISFEVMTGREQETLLIVSGETSHGDELAKLVFDFDTLHRLMGRLLSAMVHHQPEHTIESLRAVVAAHDSAS